MGSTACLSLTSKGLAGSLRLHNLFSSLMPNEGPYCAKILLFLQGCVCYAPPNIPIRILLRLKGVQWHTLPKVPSAVSCSASLSQNHFLAAGRVALPLVYLSIARKAIAAPPLLYWSLITQGLNESRYCPFIFDFTKSICSCTFPYILMLSLRA